MKPSFVFLPLLLLLLLRVHLPSQATTLKKGDLLIYLFGKNKYDRHGKYHGRWKIYHDDSRSAVMNQGRFKRGRQVGTWHYYLDDGTLYRKEVYKQKGEEIETTLFHPNGNVSVRGTARRYEDAVKIHYFWQGYWHFYTEEGKPLKTVYYSKGTAILNEVEDSAQQGKEK